MKKSLPIRVMSYNIHQGLTITKKKQTFQALKAEIKKHQVDIVLLQEVAGVTERARHEVPEPDDKISSQLEALADSAWPYFAYGKNSIFSGGFHGNAILSRFPIVNWANVDITVKPLQTRGCLHAQVQIPDREELFHVFAVHLGLWQTERRVQVRQIGDYLKKQVGSKAPIMMAGDFNDWREIVSKKLSRRHQLSEAFLATHRKHARSFPSRYPVLCLDRIYFRGLEVKTATRLKGKPWVTLSDHLPLSAEFLLPAHSS